MGRNSARQCVMALAQSMADPWTSSACIPDGSKYVVPFALRRDGNVGPTTAGQVCGIAAGIQPDAMYCEMTTSAAGGTLPATLTWSADANLATLRTLYSSVRVVSAGIKVWYTGSTMNDQGVLVVGQLASTTDPLANLQGLTSSQLIGESTYSKTFSLREGAKIAWRPESMEDQTVFYGMASVPLTASAGLDHPWLYACVFGCASSATIQYEIILNCEGYLDTQTFIPGGLNSKRTEPAVPGWYETVSNIVKDVPAYLSHAQTAFGLANTAYETFSSPIRIVNSGLNMLKNTSLLGVPRIRNDV